MYRAFLHLLRSFSMIHSRIKVLTSPMSCTSGLWSLKDFDILFNFLNAVLAFPILHVISPPPPRRVVAIPPSYVNLFVSSRFCPFTVAGSVLFPFILITLDFLLLTLSPALAACSCSLRVFLCIIC